MIKKMRFVLLSMLMLLSGSAFAEDIIWQEDWSGYEKDATPSSVNPNYSETNGGGTTKIFLEALAGGTSPELLVAKKDKDGVPGTFSAKIALNGASGEMTLAYKANQTGLDVTAENAEVGEATKSGNSYTRTITVNSGASEITITFAAPTTKNVRLDDIKLYQGVGKKPAGLSWGKASTTLTIGEEVTLVLSNENNLPVTYTSSDETVATISSEGVITLVAAGKTTLTAAFEGNDEYEAQSVSIEVTVKEGTGEVTPPTPQVEVLTVAQALEIIEGLENGAKTDKEYQVKGFVVTVTEISKQYGNATFTMADEKGGSTVLTFFRGKGFNGADITDEQLVKVDDEVIVQGLLQKYVKNEVVTPEVAQGGMIISINGKTQDDTPVEITKVADIAAFRALADGTVAELTLTNAIVTYKNVNNSNIELFIRDAKGAMDLYNLGIEAEVGQVLNGTIIGARGVSSGFTIAMKKNAQTDASTVNIGAKQEVVPVEISSIDEATYDAYGCDLVKLVGVRVSEDFKKALSNGDELALYDRFQTGLLSGLDVNTEYDITGLIYDGGATYGTELVVTALTLAGGGKIVEDPATPVASIEALLALESPSANLELTLTNAKVLFNDNNYIYVRENGKAVCFYKVDAVKELFKNNAVVNGKIQVDYELYKLLPEVKANKNTNADGLTVTESEEAAEPVQTTLADVAAGKNVCDLVTLSATLIKEVEYKEDGETIKSTTYYLQDGDTKLVVVNNGKNLSKLAEAGVETVVVTGIVNTSNNAYQIKLTKNAEDPTGINDIIADGQADGRIFNLAGQRIEKVQRGINIVGGKKLMVK